MPHIIINISLKHIVKTSFNLVVKSSLKECYTGHLYLRSHLQESDKVESAECRACAKNDESLKFYPGECQPVEAVYPPRLATF